MFLLFSFTIQVYFEISNTYTNVPVQLNTCSHHTGKVFSRKTLSFTLRVYQREAEHFLVGSHLERGYYF